MRHFFLPALIVLLMAGCNAPENEPTSSSEPVSPAEAPAPQPEEDSGSVPSITVQQEVKAEIESPVEGEGKVIQEQARNMAEALVTGDYETFTDYNHPAVVSSVGGRFAMVNGLRQLQQGLAQMGAYYESVTIGEPAAIIKDGDTWQTTIAQRLLMNQPDFYMANTSTMVAISEDAGKTWKFLDAAGQPLEAVRAMVPQISDQLVLPEPSQPEIMPKDSTQGLP